MFSVNKVVIEAFIDELVSHYSQMYGHNELDIHLLESHARNTLEIISNSDAPYHDVTHTILVTMVGQEILRGKHLLEGSVSAKTWVNFIISLLHHDIGYVRGVCFEDRGGSYVVNEQMERIMPPPGATDAYLTPYHVDRSKIYMMEHYKDDTSLELINILSCIERTRFPVPPAESHQDIGDYPGLARAADLIGQLADPQYLKKISSLFAEFSETGQSSSMGYENSADMRKGYSKFFWEKVDPYIGEGLRYLRCTQEGQQWVANLYANLFTEENEIPAFGPERRGKPDRRSLQEKPVEAPTQDRRKQTRRQSDLGMIQSINRDH